MIETFRRRQNLWNFKIIPFSDTNALRNFKTRAFVFNHNFVAQNFDDFCLVFNFQRFEFRRIRGSFFQYVIEFSLGRSETASSLWSREKPLRDDEQFEAVFFPPPAPFRFPQNVTAQTEFINLIITSMKNFDHRYPRNGLVFRFPN